MLTLLASTCEQDGGAFFRADSFQSHFGEAGGEVIEIILGVAFQRMIMAARTADPGAEKRLRHGVGKLGFLDAFLLSHYGYEIADCGHLHGIALGQQDRLRDLTPGSVGRDLGAQPLVKRPHPLCSAHVMIAFLAILQQVGQL